MSTGQANPRTTLAQHLIQDLPRQMSAFTPGRADHIRASIGKSNGKRRVIRLAGGLRRTALHAFEAMGVVVWPSRQRSRMLRLFQKYADQLPELERLYAELYDEKSRDLMVEVLLGRALGSRHVRRARDTPDYWQLYDSISSYHDPNVPSEYASEHFELPRFTVSGHDGPIQLHVAPNGLLNTFLVEHYACRRGDFDVRPEPGDRVVDGGGCFGDTALYFADRVGVDGRVHSFEFVPDNLRLFRLNLHLNPHLESRVTIHEHPMWSEPDEPVNFSSAGPGTRVGTGDLVARTETVDNLLESGRIDRVDFIKLDIEGAELAALTGSAGAIREFRPKLALSVYHRDDDLVAIPEFFRKLGVQYRWALEHVTVHQEETVLFGSPS